MLTNEIKEELYYDERFISIIEGADYDIKELKRKIKRIKKEFVKVGEIEEQLIDSLQWVYDIGRIEEIRKDTMIDLDKLSKDLSKHRFKKIIKGKELVEMIYNSFTQLAPLMVS